MGNSFCPLQSSASKTVAGQSGNQQLSVPRTTCLLPLLLEECPDKILAVEVLKVTSHLSVKQENVTDKQNSKAGFTRCLILHLTSMEQRWVHPSCLRTAQTPQYMFFKRQLMYLSSPTHSPQPSCRPPQLPIPQTSSEGTELLDGDC